ncbi:MAG: inositol oxygenase [Deltaproteobacteria bacterium]|nr:MAG: inositol oxygenase [Deltaproteobacteria bacterium]
MSDGLPRSPARAYAVAVTDRTPPGAYQNPAPRGFRDYPGNSRPGVRELYRLQHRHQTVEFVKAKRREYLSLDRRRMGIWEAIKFLDRLVDDSDPDTELSQLEHLLQTAEAARRAGHPRWFIVTALVHDLGKILCLFGEPQWAVVGDTFPVGCRFSEQVIYHEFFADNPDDRVPAYSTRLGIYEEGGGLDDVLMSWGHDEYLYHVVKDHLPDEALYVIRYHSFYAAHREGAYDYLMNDRDRQMLAWVRTFSTFDLYSKGDDSPDLVDQRPYYEILTSEFFPTELSW